MSTEPREYLDKFCAEVDREIKESLSSRLDSLIEFKESLPQFHQIEKDIINVLPALDKTRREVRAMLPQWENAIKSGNVDQEFLNTMNAKISETIEMINGVKKNFEALEKMNPWNNTWRYSEAPNDAIKFYKQNLEKSFKVYPLMCHTSNDTFRSDVINALKKGIEELQAFDQGNPPHNSAKPEVTGVGLEGERVAPPPGKVRE
jgi:DNA repair ATPase RecN